MLRLSAALGFVFGLIGGVVAFCLLCYVFLQHSLSPQSVITLVDSLGRKRIMLDATTGPAMMFFNANGAPTMSVCEKDGRARIELIGPEGHPVLGLHSTSDQTSALVLNSPKGNTRAVLANTEEDVTFILFDESGTARVEMLPSYISPFRIRGPNGKIRAEITSTADETWVQLCDSNEKSRVSLFEDVSNAALLLKDDQETRLGLNVNPMSSGFHLISNSTPQVLLELQRTGEPQFILRTKQNILFQKP